MEPILGKNIRLRTAEVTDAEFILELRSVVHKTQYLSPVENDINKQYIWLAAYKERESKGLEFYFVIESLVGNKPLGLVRVYDLQKNSFCWGSWLIKDDAPKSTAIESAMLIYEFGFGKLGYKSVHFDVRKGNDRVIAFHKRFGAKVINEDQLNYYFDYSVEDYLAVKKKYGRYLN